ncbi:glutathione S-transferase family protein [Sphingobium sp. BYY-5]|uniref:glutathione S-transferase family protein n=1 Tax=Sphingobium sp. BYY-5 TaxID=2926400 RepID=UPI001FA6F38A|nr:glutathione S-transferase family protein [Sphingobium sp. BYY-5]MCI4592444.1 glutathione S-transferase family protein [Sphingobium sp. BYY-5]
MLQFFGHPFSSYCQKALIALYENDIAFTFRMIAPDHPDNGARLAELWPIGKFPVLGDQGRAVFEASIIVEHLQIHHPGPVRLIPDDPDAALEVRLLDRFFDNHVATPQQKLVVDALRPEGRKDPTGVADARAALDKAYAWLDAHMAGRTWAAGAAFSLADCAAAPHLFYAHWSHPVAPAYAHVHAYRARLLERPSFARAVEEARPWRQYFPLGGTPDA